MRNDRVIIFLTFQELRNLFSVIKCTRDRAIFITAYRHGLRASEIGLIKINDVDFINQRIFIKRLKGSVSGIHPLDFDEIKALEDYYKERKYIAFNNSFFISNQSNAINRITLDSTMKKYGKSANLPSAKQNFNVLRNTTIMHLLSMELKTAFIKDWLGHKNMQSTNYYVKQILRSKIDDQLIKENIRGQLNWFSFMRRIEKDYYPTIRQPKSLLVNDLG